MFGAKEKCHKCGKTVYAVEKLNILDKTWHKWCFKCATCDMTLTMKNYSATGGVPYCKAHYPAPGSSEDQVKTGEASANSAANYQSGVGPAAGYSAPAAAPAAAAPAASYSAPAAAAPEEAYYEEGYAEGEYAEGEYYEEGYAEGEYAEGEYYEEGYEEGY